MVICRAQVYSIENSALLDRLGSGPPCGSVSVSQEYGLVLVFSGNKYS